MAHGKGPHRTGVLVTGQVSLISPPGCSSKQCAEKRLFACRTQLTAVPNRGPCVHRVVTQWLSEPRTVHAIGSQSTGQPILVSLSLPSPVMSTSRRKT